MALFRKFFFGKPPEGLLEMSERVYVFDCCFSVDVLGDDEYRNYVGGVVAKLRDYWADGSFVAFNFLDGESHSQIAEILSEHDITVMDYSRQYENCPLLTMEMIHHFLKSSESWLDLGQRNILLLHCESGGWPSLAFMLAALLIYRKQYTGELRTLDMIYKQAPRQLLPIVSPLNPLPSQLRYLQYISRRNLGSEWPPAVRIVLLDCIILRFIPSMDAEGGCRPIFRIYGLDPVVESDRVPKALFSTQKRSKDVQHYKQADCDLVKIDINCHIKGDVVLECINLDHELQHEEIIFRIMFNTAFIMSKMLILNRDEIDTLWNVQDHFSRDFRVEVLFLEMDSSSSLNTLDLSAAEGSFSIEAFTKPEDVLRSVEWQDENANAERNMLQKQVKFERVLADGKENLDNSTSQSARLEIMENCSPQVSKGESQEIVETSETPNSKSLENDTSNSQTEVLEEQGMGYSTTLVLNSTTKQELQAAFLRPVQSKIVSPRILQGSLSNPASYSLQESPSPLLRYQNAHSILGITALLHDTSSSNKVGAHVVTLSPRPSLSASFPQLCKSATPSLLAVLPPSELPPPSLAAVRSPAKVYTTTSPSPPPPMPSSSPPPRAPSPPLLQSSTPNISTSKEQNSPQDLDSNTLITDIGHSKSASCPSPPPLLHSGMSLSLSTNNSCTPPPPPPTPPVFSRRAASMQNSFSTSPLPPPLPPSSSLSNLAPITTMKNSSSILPPLHEIASSGDSVPFLLPNKSLELEISHSTLPPPSVNSVSESNNTTKSSSPPSPALSPASDSSSSSQSPYSSTKNSSLSPTTIMPPFPGIASSSGLMSLIVPETNSGITPPSVHVGSLSSTAATSSMPPPAQSPPSHSLTGALSPTVNSFSTIPAFPGVASLSGSISSFLPEKSSTTVARLPQPPPPPPPPLHSRALSNPPASSPLPPVPPPSCPPKESIARISPNIPPPPAPLSSALPKPGATLHSHSCGRNGNIPPTPAPPMGAKGRLQSTSNAKPQSQTKRSTLKPYHWLKLTRVLQGSLWAETRKPEEASKTPEFDMSELESLFSATVLNSDHGSTMGKSTRASKSKSDKVNLIDFRRAYNCEIMLTKIKIPLPDLMSSVLSLDDSTLDADQVDNLIKFCPTKEEMDLLKNYDGDIENLGKCEQFLSEMMKIPRAESKLRVFSFKIQFYSQVSDLRSALNLVNSASEEARNSIKLKRVMQTILSLGNALNQGTARGSAIGFRLDSLLKLADTRARNNKMTLMHYLCKVLAEKFPELVDFPKDLMSLEAATRIQLKYLAEEMQAISKGLEKVVQELKASENDGPVSESFCKTLKEFLYSAEAEVRSLALLYSAAGKNADALTQYFGEDPARCPFEQVVSTLINFVRMFIRAHKENCKQLEFEKKRAQKDMPKMKEQI